MQDERGASTVIAAHEGTLSTLTALLPRHNRVELAVHPASPALARTHAERVLADWGHEDLSETAKLIVSELVTNAIMANGMTMPDRPDNVNLYDTDGSAHIWMDLCEVNGFVVVAVWDPSLKCPASRCPDMDDEGGRGLLLVNELSAAWGHQPVAPRGKIVWATLALG